MSGKSLKLVWRALGGCRGHEMGVKDIWWGVEGLIWV